MHVFVHHCQDQAPTSALCAKKPRVIFIIDIGVTFMWLVCANWLWWLETNNPCINRFESFITRQHEKYRVQAEPSNHLFSSRLEMKRSNYSKSIVPHWLCLFEVTRIWSSCISKSLAQGRSCLNCWPWPFSIGPRLPLGTILGKNKLTACDTRDGTIFVVIFWHKYLLRRLVNL